MDKEIKKFIKELTIGNERLKRISKKLNLPYWWVESVVVEYFACRRFAYNGKLYQFDFNLFDDDLVDTIGELKVVIPHYILYQNISPKDLSYRTPRMIVGEYVEPLDKANLIPDSSTFIFTSFGSAFDNITQIGDGASLGIPLIGGLSAGLALGLMRG